jgi:hypothetical protein
MLTERNSECFLILLVTVQFMINVRSFPLTTLSHSSASSMSVIALRYFNVTNVKHASYVDNCQVISLYLIACALYTTSMYIKYTTVNFI